MSITKSMEEKVSFLNPYPLKLIKINPLVHSSTYFPLQIYYLIFPLINKINLESVLFASIDCTVYTLCLRSIFINNKQKIEI